jgi:hypothetical protein
MKEGIYFVNIKNLKIHERIDKIHFENLLKEIKRDGMIKNPIIVDRKTNVILDGHHRFGIAKKLRLKRLPAYLIDYKNPKFKVISRNGMKVGKTDVINRGLEGKPFPPKTTKHIIPKRPKNINISFESLK